MSSKNKVGRNDPCPCGSGKKYKKCHGYSVVFSKGEQRRRHSDFLGAYVDFAYLFGSEPNSREILIKEIEAFNLDDYLQTTAKVDYLLTGSFSFDDDDEMMIARDILSSNAFDKALVLKRSGQVDRIISRHQILANMVENLQLSENKSSRIVGNNLEAYGKCFFRPTGFIDRDVEDDPAFKSKSKTDNTLGLLFRIAFFNHSEGFNHLMGRYYSIFFRYLPKALKNKRLRGEAFDFVKAFEDMTGIRQKIYIILLFLAYGYYNKESMDDKKKFLQKPENFVLGNKLSSFKEECLDEARRAIRLFSNDRQEFNEKLKKNYKGSGAYINYYKLSPLLNAPFYRLPNGNYFLLDMQILQQKLTSEVKWALHDDIRDKKSVAATASEKQSLEKRRNALMAFWGRTLELYTLDLKPFIPKVVNDSPDKRLSSFLVGDPAETDMAKLEAAYHVHRFLAVLSARNVKTGRTESVMMSHMARLVADRWGIVPDRNARFRYDAFRYGNVAFLCERVTELCRDPLFGKICDTTGSTGLQLGDTIRTDFLDGSGQERKAKITIFDLSLVPQEYISMVVDAMLEENLLEALKGRFIHEPRLLVLDEAHHYLGNREALEGVYLSNPPGERIAKEGRKYGLHVMIASQRPREISNTVLSQLGTIISHALTHESNREIVAGFGTYNDRTVLDTLAILPRREAVIVGQAISMPTRFKVTFLDEEARPKSRDPLEEAFTQLLKEKAPNATIQ